ncbi:unnamed protein product [Tenebrio molitor]|nr:unnamed protein product [Tenebrio molitor]
MRVQIESNLIRQKLVIAFRISDHYDIKCQLLSNQTHDICRNVYCCCSNVCDCLVLRAGLRTKWSNTDFVLGSSGRFPGSSHATINTSNNVKFHRITDISNRIFVTIYGAFVTETIK